MKKIRCIVCSLLIVFILFVSSGVVLALESNQTKTIRVGYMNHPGYIERTEDGKFIGCGVEYLDEVSKYTNWKIEYIYASWSEQLEKLESGDIDLVPMAQYSLDRATKYLYTRQSVGLIQGLLLTLPDSDITNDVLSLNNKRIGILKGSANIDLLERYANHSGFTYQLFEYDFQYLIEKALKDNEVDIIACEQIVQTENMKVIDRFASDPYYFISSKDNKELMDELDYVISKINAYDPSFSLRLHEKYYGAGVAKNTPYFTKEEMDYINNHQKVTFALIPDNQPLAFDDKNGNTVGVIPDILKKISSLCDIEFDYVYIPKDKTPLVFLNENKNYFGTGMLATNKAFQEENVLLSDVYYTTYAALISNGKTKNKDFKTGSFSIGIPKSFQAMQLFIKEKYPNLEIKYYLSVEDGLNALESGKVDFFAYTINLLSPYLANPLYGDIHIVDNEFLPCPLCTVAIKNEDNNVMINIFNKCSKMLSSADIYQSEIKYLRDSLYVFDDYDALRRYQNIIILIIAGIATIVAICSMSLVIRQRKYNKDIARRAEFDFVTGLYNRTTLKTKIETALETNVGKPCTLLLIDIDDMKRINDTKSHEVGDEVIKKVADIIKNHFGGSAIHGRVGGDDFAVFIVGMESKSMLVSTLSRLQRTISATTVDDATVVINVSIGVSMFIAGEISNNEIYRRADEAKDFVKKNEKNGFAFYSIRNSLATNSITRKESGEYIDIEEEKQKDDLDSDLLSKINYTNSEFEKIINNLPNVALYVIEEKSHKIIYYNKRFRQICPKASIGSSCRGIMFGPCSNCIVDTMKEQDMAHTIYYSDAYGDEMEITAKKIMWEDSVPAVMIISWPRNTLTSSNDKLQKLSNQDTFDFITGGYSRQGFIRMVERMRNGGVDLTKYAVLFINVQDFKAVNELVGNNGGDNLLHSILTNVEKSDLSPVICARKESDHFVFLVEKELLDFNVLSQLLNFHWKYKDKELFILCRCGIFMIEDPKLEVYKMIDRAKLAKEHIVDEYIKPYCVFSNTMLKEYSDKAEAFLFFDQGIKNNEFVVYYQPIVDAYTKKIVSAEALVRRKSPDGQITSPGKFIPIFEKTGYISKLDKFVGNVVCKFQQNRNERNLPIVPISFNLSQMDFYDKDFIDELTREFESGAIPKDAVMLEVTESAYTLSEEKHENLLHSLHNAGVMILLDDFGTGYSSFGMFERYYFDRIKLDMSFVRQLPKNNNVIQVVKAIISMCHKLNIKVVAEGVEIEEELLALQKLGCDYIQGYYFSKPLDEESFIKYLEDAFKESNSKND